MSGVSQDLQWLLVRTNTAFLVKQQGLPRIFTREPSNLRQIHSYTYSGLVNDKRVGVEAAPSGRGVVVTTRKSKAAPNAIKGSTSSTTIKKGGSRRTAGAVASVIGKRGYRSDLLKDAVARSSAILKTQRPKGRKQPPARKVRGTGARQALFKSHAAAEQEATA